MDIRFKGEGDQRRYTAVVSFRDNYYGSATFPLRSAAEAWYETTLVKAIRGELLPLAEREAQEAALAAQAAAEAVVDQPFPKWASAYLLRATDRPHGNKRDAEYTLVGEQLKDKSLRQFQGQAGALLIQQLSEHWKHGRQHGEEPLKRSTLRKRMTALMRLIDWAAGQLPAGVAFTPPDWKYLKRFGWSLPPAHADRRTRECEDDELAQLLAGAGLDSDFSQLLEVLDENGGRLGEVLHAHGAQLSFFYDANGQLFGGKLHLAKHKTEHRTKTARDVPLSLRAAQILLARKKAFGNGPLFAALGNNDTVCKKFRALCERLGIKDLVSKDLRRAFINRNKGAVPVVDMVHIVGQSCELDLEHPGPGVKAVQAAVGHKRLDTTVGYTVLQLQQLAGVFTGTSRNARVRALAQVKAQMAAAHACERALAQVKAQAVACPDGPATAAPARPVRRHAAAEPAFDWHPATPQVRALQHALGFSIDQYQL